MLHIGTGTQKRPYKNVMIHPLHSCKGKCAKMTKGKE